MTTKSDSQPKGHFISLRVKLLLGFTLIFSAVFAAAFFWFYNFATNMAISRIQEDMEETLAAAVEGIDTEALIALHEEGEANEAGFSDDPRYTEQIAWMETVHDIEPRAWPYTYVKGNEPNEVIFIADLWSAHDPDRAGAFNEPYISEGPMYDGLFQLTVDTNPYTDDWGRWVSAWTPILDEDGNQIGGMGIDFDAKFVDDVQAAIRNSVGIAFAVTYTTLFLLVWLLSGALTKPMTDLTHAAARIGEGDYEQDLNALTKDRFPDEIDTLADVFSIMVSKVYKREQSLRQQVEELRIIVDQTKKEQQVAEIVSTDFFNDLQSKAHEMRARKQSAQKSKEGEG